ncbi:MAG: MvaI/BcnI family restriction endonuclease [Prevotellaceae bacterium]|jgi:hypothetical protein|nr:MvaI/BcnI family restriction endonuclease [Prevotellaceae bacterium]
MKLYTKENLIKEFQRIAKQGWIENARKGNAGGIGNTLEDLLGIDENNLPIPNAAEWELKTQRLNTTALTTLFHTEPSPRAIKFVPQVLLLNYGWKHQQAGAKYAEDEMSFRQTIHGNAYSDRGFIVKVDRANKKVLISFNYKMVSVSHKAWLKEVKKRIGFGELNPQPYWGFDDLANKAGTKLLNCFYVQAEVKKEEGKEFYHYSKVMMLQKFNFIGFLNELENGNILIDFDARTGHNHGTKFRLKQRCFPNLYEKTSIIIE